MYTYEEKKKYLYMDCIENLISLCISVVNCKKEENFDHTNIKSMVPFHAIYDGIRYYHWWFTSSFN